MRRTRTRWPTAFAGALAATALLAACGEPELPQPDPEPPAATAGPVLDADRLTRVIGEVADTLAEADEARDGDLLAPRVTGPAADMRVAEYRLLEATDGEDELDPFTAETQVEAVAATEDFPRTAMVVTQVPEGGNLPLLLALVQSEARENFRLWGWVELFPGIETPALIHPETGSAPVAADAEGLVATPAEVIERYAAIFADPDADGADAFTDDPYRTSVQEAAADLDDAVEAAGGAALSAEAGDDGPVALATADGGALVMGEIRTALELRKTEFGSELRAGGTLGALLGDDNEVRGTVSGMTDVLVGLYVPPAGADDQTVQVLGANAVLADVERDDDEAPEEEDAE